MKNLLYLGLLLLGFVSLSATAIDSASGDCPPCPACDGKVGAVQVGSHETPSCCAGTVCADEGVEK